TPEIAAARDGATLRLPPSAFRACREPGDCARGGDPDWILVALKATALDQAPALLAPMLGPSTRVIAMCNGLGVEERLARNADPARHGMAVRIEEDWVREMMERTPAMGAYATSTLLDWRAGKELEIDAIFGEPVRRARELGVAVPGMEELLQQVRQRTADSG